MAKTNLAPIRVSIREADPPTRPDLSVEVAYAYTTSDGETMSKTRDITANLSATQRTKVEELVTLIRSRISTAEGIA